MTTKIVFRKLDKDAPGYLLLSKKALEFTQQIKKEPTPDLIDDLVEFLLPFISEPANRADAEDALLNASENQFLQLINEFGGGTEKGNPTLPAPSEKS